MTLPIRLNSTYVKASWYNDIKTEIEALPGPTTVETLENKTIDADDNTISNLEVDNLKAGVLDTDLSSVSASDDTIPSAKATKTYIDASAAGGTVSTKTADYAVLDGDNIRTVLVGDGVDPISITLPTASANTNRIITVKSIRTDGGNTILDGEGSEEIDGELSIPLPSEKDSITVQCDGVGWNIISEDIAISMKYTNTAGSAFPVSATTYTVPFPTLEHDTHSGFAGSSTYTVPRDGLYTVKIKLGFLDASGVNPAITYTSISIVPSVGTGSNKRLYVNKDNAIHTNSLTDSFRLSKNDTILTQGTVVFTGTGPVTLFTSSGWNSLAISYSK